MSGPLGSFLCNLSAVLGSAVGQPPAAAAPAASGGLVTDGGDNLVTDTGDRLVFG